MVNPQPVLQDQLHACRPCFKTSSVAIRVAHIASASHQYLEMGHSIQAIDKAIALYLLLIGMGGSSAFLVQIPTSLNSVQYRQDAYQIVFQPAISIRESVLSSININERYLDRESGGVAIGRHLSFTAAYSTQLYLFNALIAIIIPFTLASRRAPEMNLSQAIFCGTSGGLFYDNTINAFARNYIGGGHALRVLTKIRLILHGLTIPSLFVPLIEIAMHSGLLSGLQCKIAVRSALSIAIFEALSWSSFDINELSLVDDPKRAIPGTLQYTSGRLLKCLLPCVILQLFTLLIGCLVRSRWLIAAGALTILSSSLQRPDYQTCGETVNLSLIWAGWISVIG
mmetsp:Transcript_3720/g.9469  ORF Transcript_3720/g.9469 Transcript_3720/m.9469 type:complete len:340 (-) Transcript_3720:598-1617(-)|eukprot:CAMPEP_0181083208 /NCGR_PEP_ID=MMETSP1071-20121207/4038_1 /TAXON_ID=35127 /ORGANISM="Thalassiosira sp., Strain NH16" /LENGTH=339 /DNA_ID=CAMNT_0023164857 /DNA_START=53 /DNA_END=1072 /DNA_ORIENTATION=-